MMIMSMKQRAGKRARSSSSMKAVRVVPSSVVLAMAAVLCRKWEVVEGAFAGPSKLFCQVGGSMKLESQSSSSALSLWARSEDGGEQRKEQRKELEKSVATLLTTAAVSLAMVCNPLQSGPAHAEDELYAKYGNKGFDSSLVDKNCLVDKCSLQAKACLGDDPECRKGLTCTAKCLGDNACITGCFAKYGTPNLDRLLKCTIEDHECIKVAILDGGADDFHNAPRSPAPTVRRFDLASMEGTWYKVAGYNPNYDCYACQRNTFSAPEGGPFPLLSSVGADRLQVDVEFSMPRMLSDGSPLPPSGVRESFDNGLQSVGYNAYSTHETMVFDSPNTSPALDLVLGKGTDNEASYARTAHSEGEMFGLKFWENWYVIGENDPGRDEFKFIYYNGKTRQNTYDGAFIYSRSRTLSPESMEKVYRIAQNANMNPNQFCKIQNNCFDGDDILSPSSPTQRDGLGSPSNPFRGILASTKVSQILGVESVAAESIPRSRSSTSISSDLAKQQQDQKNRPWWKEVGDYLEDPRKHFRLMESLRTDMDWPEYIKERN